MREHSPWYPFRFRSACAVVLNMQALIAFVTLSAAPMCFADLLSFKTFKLTNNTGKFADDFEISVGSGKISKFRLDIGDLQFDPTTLPATSLALKNGAIANGGQIGFTIGFQDFDGKSFTANWTQTDAKGNVTNIGAALALANSVRSNYLGGGISSAIVDIANPLSTGSVSVSNLAFATDVEGFDMFADDPSTLTYGSPLAFTLAADQATSIALANVTAGSLVVAEGTADFGNGDVENFYAAFSTSPAPEPNYALPVAALLAGLVLWRRSK